ALPVGVEKTPIGPLDQCGVWQIISPSSSQKTEKSARSDAKPATPAAKPVVEIACNLASRTESDLRVPEPLLKTQTLAVMAAGWITRPIWFYFVAAAWGLAAVEWFLYQRRWIS
ncbi:MAG TPA: hypothetical protein VGI40_09480, partial [Pirellulaceae bacterium]